MIDKDRELHCKIQVGEFFYTKCTYFYLTPVLLKTKSMTSNLKELSEPLDINKMII